MPNQIISDSFETLGGMVQGAGKQVKQIAKKMGEDVAEQLAIKQQQQQAQDEKTQAPVQTEEQNRKIKEAGEKRAIAKYEQLQEEIKQMGQKRTREIQKYRMPGFTDEEKQQKQIQQIQENKEPEKKLPPLPVQRAQKRTEMNRGASG